MNGYTPINPQGQSNQQNALTTFAESLVAALQDSVQDVTVALIQGFLEAAIMQGYQTIAQLNNPQVIEQVLGNTRSVAASPAKAKARARKVDPSQPEYGCHAMIKPRNGVNHPCGDRAVADYGNLLCSRHGKQASSAELLASLRSQGVQPRPYVKKTSSAASSPNTVVNQSPLVPEKVQFPGTNLWICHGSVLNGVVLSPATNGIDWIALVFIYGIHDDSFILHCDPMPDHYVREIAEGYYNTPGMRIVAADPADVPSYCDQIKENISANIIAINQSGDLDSLTWVINLLKGLRNPSPALPPRTAVVAKATPIFNPSTQGLTTPNMVSPYSGAVASQPASPYAPINNAPSAAVSHTPLTFGSIGSQVKPVTPVSQPVQHAQQIPAPVFGQSASPFPAAPKAAPAQPLQPAFGQVNSQPAQPAFGQVNSQPAQPLQPAFGQVNSQPAQPLQPAFGQVNSQPAQPLQPAFGQVNSQPAQPLQPAFGQVNPQQVQPAFGQVGTPTKPVFGQVGTPTKAAASPLQINPAMVASAAGSHMIPSQNGVTQTASVQQNDVDGLFIDDSTKTSGTTPEMVNGTNANTQVTSSQGEPVIQ